MTILRASCRAMLLVSLTVAIPAAGQTTAAPQPKPAKAQPSSPPAVDAGTQAAQPTVSAQAIAAISAAARELALPRWVPAAEQPMVNRIIASLKADKKPEAYELWRRFLAETKAVPPPDPGQMDALAGWVVREAYLTPNPELASAADKLRFVDEQRAAFTEQLNRLRSARDSAEGAKPVLVRLFVIRSSYAPGQRAVVAEQVTKLTRQALSSRMRTFETSLEVANNIRMEYMTAFENFDQKTNQLFNILSTVLKTMKETQSGIARNVN